MKKTIIYLVSATVLLLTSCSSPKSSHIILGKDLTKSVNVQDQLGVDEILEGLRNATHLEDDIYSGVTIEFGTITDKNVPDLIILELEAVPLGSGRIKQKREKEIALFWEEVRLEVDSLVELNQVEGQTNISRTCSYLVSKLERSQRTGYDRCVLIVMSDMLESQLEQFRVEYADDLPRFKDDFETLSRRLCEDGCPDGDLSDIYFVISHVNNRFNNALNSTAFGFWEYHYDRLGLKRFKIQGDLFITFEEEEFTQADISSN
jgi:hypothetical protein